MEKNVSTETKIPNENESENTVLKAIERYKNHPSILAISQISQMKEINMFSFKDVSCEHIKNQLIRLDSGKASQDTDIPTKIIKENADIVADFIYQNFNNAIACSAFPINLKNANVTPVHQKDSRENGANYRPVSILPNISKI